MRLSYSEAEVEDLIAHYVQLRARKSTDPRRIWILLRLADLDRALHHLRRDFREVVVVYGFLGLDSRTAGEILQVSHTAVNKRYRRAVEELVYLMNGGE